MNPPRILIAGDSMLDRYWFGTVERTSPEAPVPIVPVDRIEERPGGAANVALCAAMLGAEVTLMSMIGADDDGRRLAELLPGLRNLLYRDHDMRTTLKLRVVDRAKHHIARIDFDGRPSEEALLPLNARFSTEVEDADIVVLSDYDKGVLRNAPDLIAAAAHASKRVLVDPKGDFARYTGAWLLKPNEAEFAGAVGRWHSQEDLCRRAGRLQAELALQHLLITLGPRGMVLFSRGGACTPFRAEAREVFDVCGAGDAVLATLAVMLARGESLPEAVRKANRAAGIVVGKFGTATVTAEELLC